MERNFKILKWYNDDSWIVLNQDDDSILCQGLTRFPYLIYLPIEWKTYSDCEKWCNFGFISELQETFGNLQICFVKNLVYDLTEE